MVTLTISVHARPQKCNELLSTCKLITEQACLENGCLSCRISRDVDNENLIYLEEIWDLRSSLDAHFCSDVFSALIGAIQLLGAKHELSINDGAQTEGMDAVQAARLRIKPKEANP